MTGACHLTGNVLCGAGTPTTELIGMYILLAAFLIAGGAVVVWAARRFRQSPPDRLTPQAELQRFRELVARGDMSAEEFERVRTLLEPGGADSRKAPPGRA